MSPTVTFTDGTPIAFHRTGAGPPAVTAPTLVVGGSKSPARMRNAVRAVADRVPNAQHHTLQGRTHLVKAKALAPVLTEFFAS